MRTRLPVALLVLLACSACEEQQEAQPLSKTVPLALVLAAVGFGAIGGLTVWAWRRAAGGSPLQYPRLTAALVLAPTALVGSALVAVLVANLAVGYRRARLDMFSWDDWLGITLVVGGIALFAHLVFALIAVAVTSEADSSRFVGRVALFLAAGGLALCGAGLLWFPAAVFALIGHRPPVEAVITQPSLSSKR